MTQTAVPTADVSTTGWTRDDGGTTALYGTLDETIADDGDYAISISPAGDPFEVQLASLIDPASSAGHIVTYRIGASGPESIAITASLRQGAATEIAAWAHDDVSALTTYDQTLSAGQANAITNYADLRLRFVAALAAAGALINVDGGFVLNSDDQTIVSD